jgi:hypothetical protein
MKTKTKRQRKMIVKTKTKNRNKSKRKSHCRKVKHRKMENLDPRQVQINRVTVIKLGRIDEVDHMNK